MASENKREGISGELQEMHLLDVIVRFVMVNLIAKMEKTHPFVMVMG